MPESGAVYQPTTVGYAYDTRDGGGFGIRSGFSRIMSRHKFSTRSWLEWVLLSVAAAAFVAGLTTMLVNIVSADGETNHPQKVYYRSKIFVSLPWGILKSFIAIT